MKMTGKILVYAHKFAKRLDQELNQWPSAYKFNSLLPDYHIPVLFTSSEVSYMVHKSEFT
jgi:hypothetical protein